MAEAATQFADTRRSRLPGEVNMTPEEEEALVRYLDQELSLASGERAEFVQRLVQFQDAYRAPKPTQEKNFPFKRASQITIPVIKMITNVIVPRIVSEILRPSPLISLRSTVDEQIFERVSKPTEEFIDMYLYRRCDIERKVEDLILEGCKFGGAVWEVSRDVERRQIVRYGPDGETIEIIEEGPERTGPQIFNVPLEDFWWKFGFTDIQKMPWVGKVVHLTTKEIKDRVAAGFFRPEGAERVVAVGGTHGRGVLGATREVTTRVEQHERTATLLSTLDLFDIFELYVYWPIRVNRKTVTADLRVFYHMESRTLLRVQLNPWWHGQRPFIVWQYSPVEHRLIGEGLCEMLDQLQEEISTIHRQRIDNATLANMRMIVTSRAIEGLRPGDPLYPGKVIRASSTDDVKPLQLTEVYPSTFTNEQVSMTLAERISGVNEAMLGRALPVTRTTATAQMQLLEENRQRFELAIRRARRVIGKAGEMIYDQFHQFGTGGLAQEWLGDRGLIVEELFRMPRERVVAGFAVNVVPTTARVNRQIEMQSNLQLFQLLVQLHQQLLPIAQAFAPQALPVIGHALVSSARRFMLRVLEAFDEKDPEGVLEALALLERILPSPASQGVAQDIRSQLEDLSAALSGLPADVGRAVGTSVSEVLGGLEGAIRSATGSPNGGGGLGGGIIVPEGTFVP